ncbi:MAG: hypothetical protein MHPSP_000510 [Paramarteilia canceri]
MVSPTSYYSDKVDVSNQSLSSIDLSNHSLQTLSHNSKNNQKATNNQLNDETLCSRCEKILKNHIDRQFSDPNSNASREDQISYSNDLGNFDNLLTQPIQMDNVYNQQFVPATIKDVPVLIPLNYAVALGIVTKERLNLESNEELAAILAPKGDLDFHSGKANDFFDNYDGVEEVNCQKNMSNPDVSDFFYKGPNLINNENEH